MYSTTISQLASTFCTNTRLIIFSNKTTKLKGGWCETASPALRILELNNAISHYFEPPFPSIATQAEFHYLPYVIDVSLPFPKLNEYRSHI